MATSIDVRPRRARPPLVGLLLVLALQPVWALPFAFFFGTLLGARWPVYVMAYRISLVFAYCIGTGIWAVRTFVEPRLHATLTRGRELGVRIGGSYVAVAIAGSYLAAWLIHLYVLPGFLGSTQAWLISTLYTLLFVGLFGGINFAIAFYRVMVEQARAIERQRAELARAELRALRAQINPHFLFNTLNTIAALAAERPAEAEDTTTRLADLFRYALAASERDHQRLGDELAFVRDYLAIERIRLGERLRVRVDVEPGLEAVPVPSLLLQPLVENAVLHGVAPRVSGGTVTISARRLGDTLEVAVEDDGPGFTEPPAGDGAGFGLRSVRERVRLAGPPHALEVTSTPGRGTRISLVLPLVPASPLPPGGPS